MTLRGHVKNGQIALDDAARLPEGTRVNVEVLDEGVKITRPQRRKKIPKFEPIQMPGGPLSDDIVNDRR